MASLKQYEKKYAELEAIVKELDEGELSMSDILARYKKGLTLVKDCSHMLSEVEEEVNQLMAEVKI